MLLMIRIKICLQEFLSEIFQNCKIRLGTLLVIYFIILRVFSFLFLFHLFYVVFLWALVA